MTTPHTLVIPFSEALSPDSIALDELKVFDISWGEKADNSEWSMDGNNPRFAVRDVSAQVSADGLKLVVSLPDAGRSAKYLLELGSLVEDLAGNLLTLTRMECHERFAPITLLVRYPHFSLVNRISRILNCAHALLNTSLNCLLRMLCSGRVTLFLEAWLDMSCTTSKVGCSRSYGQAPFKSQGQLNSPPSFR